MHIISNFSRLYINRAILLIIVLGLAGCGGGASEIPLPLNATPAPTSPESEVELELGKPFVSPALIPPSASQTSVVFRSKISGYQNPPETLLLDEVDAEGNVVSENVGQLYDDGEGVDSYLGDRTYSGSVKLGSELAQTKYYRVRVEMFNEVYTSKALTFWVSGCPTDARPSDKEKVALDAVSGNEIYTNEVLIILTEDAAPSLVAVNTIASTVGGQVVGCVPELKQFLIEFPGDLVLDVENAINTLESSVDVAEALPNVKLSISDQAGGTECEDESCEWYIEKIRADAAWQLAGAGDEEIAVGLLDFGVDCSHGELNCDPLLVATDAIDHGTGVASMIFAKNDDNSVTGVAYKTVVYPHSFIGDGGSVYKMSELINTSLNDENVKVINISAGSPIDPNNQILNSICSAIASGRLVVAAAGNASQPDCALEEIYPAKYNSEGYTCPNGANLQKGLLVVGATDPDNDLAEWNVGGSGVCGNTLYADIHAPGENVLTASIGGAFLARNGTSFATPLVSGAAAVLWASNPELTVSELHDQIINSAAELSSDSTNPRAVTTSERMQGKRLLDMFSMLGGEEINGELPDFEPNDFVFLSKPSAALGADYVSDRITIQGLDIATSIDIENGFYSIDGGPWTSAAGQISNGQVLRIRVKASEETNSTTEAQVVIGGVAKTFEVTTGNGETNVKNLTFATKKNVTAGAFIESTLVSLTDLPANSSIQVEGGSYSINGGDYTSASGTISAGDTLRIGLTSGTEYGETFQAIVTVNGVEKRFRVSTSAADVTPNGFSFADANAAPIGTVVERNVTVSGINSPSYISISGETAVYRIGEGEFTNDIGTVNNGDEVTVQLTASAAFSRTRYATLNIGGVSASFSVTTEAADASPGDFAFQTLTEVELDTAYQSNVVTIDGINTTAPISIVNGSYSLDEAPYTTAAGQVRVGQTVVVQVQSSAEFGTPTSATLTVGDLVGSFTVTTMAEDTTPDTFAFDDINNVLPGSTQTSNSVTINGINTAAPISINGGTYSINGSDFTGTAGTVSEGDSVVVSLATGTNYSVTYSITLDVGGVTAVFSAQTEDGAPRLEGAALLTDVDQNGLFGEGDSLAFTFDRNVTFNSSVDPGILFSLPIAGDTFGTSATLSAGINADEVIITLGTNPVLTVMGNFNPLVLRDGSASGIDINTSAPTGSIVEVDSGIDAASSVIDLIPAFVPIPSPLPSNVHEEAVLNDINGDGLPEYISTSVDSTNIYINFGQNFFSAQDSFAGGMELAVGEFTGASPKEIVLAQEASVDIYSNTDGYLLLNSIVTSPAISSIVDVQVGLLDDDGLEDIVVLGSDGLLIYFQQADGSFAPFSLITQSTDGDLIIADMDGDEDMDIVHLSSSSSGNSGVFVNEGGGSFSPFYFNLGVEISAFAVGDVNGDALADFMIADSEANQVNLYSQEAVDSYKLTDMKDSISPNQGTTFALTLVDLDGDNDLDLLRLTLDTLEHEMVYFNSGEGEFGVSPQLLNVGTTRTIMITGDTDGDGDIDFILSDPNGNIGPSIFVNSLSGFGLAPVGT